MNKQELKDYMKLLSNFSILLSRTKNQEARKLERFFNEWDERLDKKGRIPYRQLVNELVDVFIELFSIKWFEFDMFCNMSCLLLYENISINLEKLREYNGSDPATIEKLSANLKSYNAYHDFFKNTESNSIEDFFNEFLLIYLCLTDDVMYHAGNNVLFEKFYPYKNIKSGVCLKSKALFRKRELLKVYFCTRIKDNHSALTYLGNEYNRNNVRNMIIAFKSDIENERRVNPLESNIMNVDLLQLDHLGTNDHVMFSKDYAAIFRRKLSLVKRQLVSMEIFSFNQCEKCDFYYLVYNRKKAKKHCGHENCRRLCMY